MLDANEPYFGIPHDAAKCHVSQCVKSEGHDGDHLCICGADNKHGEQPVNVIRTVEPFVMVDDPANPPWCSERVCPNCGAADLPLESATSTNGRITLTYINHCNMQWLRGPMGVNP